MRGLANILCLEKLQQRIRPSIIVVVVIKLKHLKSSDGSKLRNKIKLFRECLHKIKLNVVRVVKLKNVSRSAQCGVMWSNDNNSAMIATIRCPHYVTAKIPTAVL